MWVLPYPNAKLWLQYDYVIMQSFREDNPILDYVTITCCHPSYLIDLTNRCYVFIDNQCMRMRWYSNRTLDIGRYGCRIETCIIRYGNLVYWVGFPYFLNSKLLCRSLVQEQFLPCYIQYFISKLFVGTFIKSNDEVSIFDSWNWERPYIWQHCRL